jgi:5-methylcytosine-specific restriction endonuclease McrA
LRLHRGASSRQSCPVGARRSLTIINRPVRVPGGLPPRSPLSGRTDSSKEPFMPAKLIARRLRAFNAQAGRCYYCGYPMWVADPQAFAAINRITIGQARRFQCTAEHLIARCDGGPDAGDNIVAACRHCNLTRHRSPHPLTHRRYRDRVRRRLARGKWHPAALRSLQAGRTQPDPPDAAPVPDRLRRPRETLIVMVAEAPDFGVPGFG